MELNEEEFGATVTEVLHPPPRARDGALDDEFNSCVLCQYQPGEGNTTSPLVKITNLYKRLRETTSPYFINQQIKTYYDREIRDHIEGRPEMTLTQIKKHFSEHVTGDARVTAARYDTYYQLVDLTNTAFEQTTHEDGRLNPDAVKLFLSLARQVDATGKGLSSAAQ